VTRLARVRLLLPVALLGCALALPAVAANGAIEAQPSSKINYIHIMARYNWRSACAGKRLRVLTLESSRTGAAKELTRLSCACWTAIMTET
jgi:hypothetical protein